MLASACFTRLGSTGLAFRKPPLLKAASVNGTVAIDPNASVFLSAPQDAGDRLIYDPATLELLYDADGTGSIAAERIAQLLNVTSLSGSDFFGF